VLFPLKDEALRERICKEILPPYLADNRKARVLGADGQYTHLRRCRNGKTFSVQEHRMNLARGFVNGSGRPGRASFGNHLYQKRASNRPIRGRADRRTGDAGFGQRNRMILVAIGSGPAGSGSLQRALTFWVEAAFHICGERPKTGP
jgi:hypothetical protein